MPVPDQVPKSPEQQSAELKRRRAVALIQNKLPKAVLRINEFVATHDPHQVIRRIHTAKTDVQSSDGETMERHDYYSLWDMKGTRILDSGQLARPVRETPFYVEGEEADESHIITWEELRTDDKYTLHHLGSIAAQLDRILPPSP